LLPNVGGTLVFLSIPLTIVGMVGVINAVNMTDGVDGLAGGLSILTFGALAYLTYPTDLAVSQQLITFVAVLLGFLIFNSRFFGRKRAAIFLGDGGSIFIGFAVAWYLISLSQGDHAVIKPVDALWLLAVPLIDTMTIMIRRIRHGRSPFSADREHLHHILMLAGFGANGTVLIILASHALFILIGIASIRYHFTEWIAFAMFGVVFMAYSTAMNHAWKVMKQIKHFREWAGFEDRRKENRRTMGRSSGSDRRFARDEPLARPLELEVDVPGH
jgi:UDP-GlcNAc:undecaprenyl-phosphate GlcNAc-1-phosphate transferase